eukprot:360692-Chlamydomonas_euryale.AAC.1
MYFAAKFTGGVCELGRDDRRASGVAVKLGPSGEDVCDVWGSGVESAPRARLKQRCTTRVRVGTDKKEKSPMPSPVRGEGIQGGLLFSKHTHTPHNTLTPFSLHIEGGADPGGRGWLLHGLRSPSPLHPHPHSAQHSNSVYGDGM